MTTPEITPQGGKLLRECDKKFQEALELWVQGDNRAVTMKEEILGLGMVEVICLDCKTYPGNENGAWLVLYRPAVATALEITIEGSLEVAHGILAIVKSPGEE